MKKLLLLICLLMTSGAYQDEALHWKLVEYRAKGQIVYMHAWGGSEKINKYLHWVNTRLLEEYGVTLKHVKINDTADLIQPFIDQKKAGRNSNGEVDIVWLNGENFKKMKLHGLLSKPFSTRLPNWVLVNKSLPVDKDFSELTLGLEVPWGIGQLLFIYDTNRTTTPPNSFSELLSYAKLSPNKLTYPKPPSFIGSSFLKAALLELSADKKPLYQMVDAETFQQISSPLWTYLDKFHDVAWQQGKEFPTGSAQMIKLLNEGVLDLALTFNPNEVISAQANGSLTDSTEIYAFKNGALTQAHFLAIPWNANAEAGALVAINFMLSPEAQSVKGEFSVWGDPTILAPQYVTGSAKKTKLFKPLEEPHSSWQRALNNEWRLRYGD
ncbi:ABC transporter substrate-binding protein [Psychromonas ossibalaenae]|uniref:ABC transporter substrate-binding protein n=1 Tax=Psychromonas ossibalaenae TaxID=444922 RepID=UPI00036E1D85|nr:ABC transporter substrate-binding protein [Psychromonas ossibalaenae]